MSTVSETPSPLRAARLAQGLRLVDVAGKADIAVSYLSMIERGLTPPAPVRGRLAKALEKPEAALFRGAL